MPALADKSNFRSIVTITMLQKHTKYILKFALDRAADCPNNEDEQVKPAAGRRTRRDSKE